ncbi:MAG: polymorphic toxin type 17 domain-containing protein, partial [Chryseobacterium sp.]|nr:polymorphic toxin type 17 domain-containing protein [Chryseobacterium sp.]
YDLGGNLNKIFNEDGYKYVTSVKYDHYEQRTNIVFGNDTSSTFTYEPGMRRLKKHLLVDANSNSLLDGTYHYDYASNIIGIENTSQTTNTGFGGNYAFNYEYDTLNRLIRSSGNAAPGRKEGLPPNPIVGTITSMYNTELSYNLSSGIEIKRQHHEQDGVVNTQNSYRNEYHYLKGTHMVEKVRDLGTGNEEYFKYDSNGNAVVHETIQTGATNFFWDEQDRLRAVHTPEIGSFQYYVYDDKGERTIKANLRKDTELYQNGEMIDNGIHFNDFKVYPNPYVVYTSDGMFTKHYFAGSQRIASRIADSGGIFNSRQATSAGSKDGLDPKDKQSAADADFKSYLSKAGYEKTEIEKEFARAPAPVGGIYYLHGDHLGTATYVTNEYAEPTQFFLNLPFGETMVEQQEPTAYVNPYKFNAKELDSETGLYYYGARYFNPRLSIWYGVDPLAVYNPVMETEFYGDGQHNDGVYNWGNLNPYIYTYQNPVRYVDPNGKQVEWSEFWDGFNETLYKTDRKNTLDTGRWHSSGPKGSSKSYTDLAIEKDEMMEMLNSSASRESGKAFSDITMVLGALITPGPADDAAAQANALSNTVRRVSSKKLLKDAQLPTQGRVRFIPSAADLKNGKLTKKNNGYLDKFGNTWKKGPSRTKDEAFEWDVQLTPKTGKLFKDL